MPSIDESRWRYVITDMNGSTTPSGTGQILSAAQKQYAHNLNGGKTAQCSMAVDNPTANYIMSNDCLLKVYRKQKISGTWKLLMVGDVIHAEESGSGDTAMVNLLAADPWWRIGKRLIGMAMDTIGRGTGYSDGSATALKDYSTLTGDLITNMNSVFPLGISLGTVQLCGATGFIGPVFAQTTDQVIQQFTNILGGPSIEIVPNEPSALMPNTNIATLNVWQILGTTRNNTVFEYGTGQFNMASYNRLKSKDGIANMIYSPPQGFPDVTAAGDHMVTSQDTASQNAIGLYQDVVQADVTALTLRQALADNYLAVRKQSQQQITFTPTVDCNLDYTVDYNVGDVVIARALINNTYRFNGSSRLYGVNFIVDDNDAETPSLTLIPGTV